jgi:hypothetical protein
MRVGKMKARRIVPLPPKQDEVNFGGGTNYYAPTLAANQIGDLAGDGLGANGGLTKWCVTLGTLAGGLGSVLPIDEKNFRRLDLLQQAMITSMYLPRNAGLHPLQSSLPRGIIQKRPSTMNKSTKTKNIIDGRIIWRFVDLDKVAQRKISLSIGSTVDTILDTLLEVDLHLMLGRSN